MNRPTTDGASAVGAPAAPPERRLWRIVVSLLVLLVIAAAVVAFLLARTSTDDAEKDVTVGRCSADPGGGKPTASGRIVNNSSKTSNYVVKLAFDDASGNSVSEGAALVKDVEKGATASWGLTDSRSAKGPLKCEITGVSRTHLPGR